MDNEELTALYSHQTLKIGQALKWRGVYDNSLSYYRDNVVCMCSCVFWCKQLFTREVPPLVYRSSDNTYQFANQETWVCLVDNLWLYNNSSQLKEIEQQYRQSLASMQPLIDRANEALGNYDDYIISVVHAELNRLRVGALDIRLYSTEGQFFRKSGVDTILYAKIYCNDFDVTDVCTGLIHEYTWSRDTKNTVLDEQWGRSPELLNDGLAVRIVDDSTRHDLGDGFFSRREKAKFTLNVSVVVDSIGLTTEAQQSLNII